ncbi:HNH endonuclease [Aeromicrobium sp. 179-A 4D2 NHS]|uniref:HNH endonuclease n=1 Tax=Aeromicrobium sp. 179-A 4D2 NHS TaxID=3142375 RepID=UPI0039A1599C
MTVLTGDVLVLNASYEPMKTVSMKHAIKMIVREVAVIEEALDSAISGFVLPKVLRLVKYVNMTWRYNREAVCSKRAVLVRDRYKCGYCGGKANTMDHIMPRSRGGLVTWENSISACLKCNSKKANRTPEEARMPLLFAPTVPTVIEIATRRRDRAF